MMRSAGPLDTSTTLLHGADRAQEEVEAYGAQFRPTR